METCRGDRSLGFSLGRLVRFAERVDAEHKLGLSGCCKFAHTNLGHVRSWLHPLIIRLVDRIRKSKDRVVEGKLEAFLWELHAVLSRTFRSPSRLKIAMTSACVMIHVVRSFDGYGPNPALSPNSPPAPCRVRRMRGRRAYRAHGRGQPLRWDARDGRGWRDRGRAALLSGLIAPAAT
jgi:hypothetical protein